MNFSLKLKKFVGKFTFVNFSSRLTSACLILMCIFCVILTLHQHFIYESFCDLGVELLEDVLESKILPRTGKSIFFLETTAPLKNPESSPADYYRTQHAIRLNMAKLNARQACAVESAALHNPKSLVFVLFASPRYKYTNKTSGASKTRNEAILEAILSYENVHLRNLNLWAYAANTPIYEFVKNGTLFKSRYLVEHMSDFLRFLTLWRWGGTYLDMDTVMLRSMEDLPPNYAGAESDEFLGNSVMNFGAEGFGRKISRLCLRNFQQYFDGNDWGKNGPGVITRVIQRVCGTKNINLMMDTTKRCSDFKVYPSEAFFAIDWAHWSDFFEPEMLNKTMQRIKNSYLAHIWNKNSKKYIIKIGTKCAYSLMAELHCPRVYKAAGLYF